MEAQNDPKFRADFWDRVFPGQLPAGEVDVTVVDERGFELDGVALVPVEVGHTDTDATTMLHVPEMGLLVAGDVVYNGVHLYLTESGGVTGIDEWLAALDTAENLNPATVIAGHKAPRRIRHPLADPGDAALPDRRAPTASVVGLGGGVLRGNAAAAPQPSQPRRAVGRGHHALSARLSAWVAVPTTRHYGHF